MSKPLLKWAGGKTQLLGKIEETLPEAFKKGDVRKFAEPFFGGGAVFFHLAEKYDLESAYISDMNKGLIILYRTVQQDVASLICKLQVYKDQYFCSSDEDRKKMFYQIREEFNAKTNTVNIDVMNEAMIDRAAQIVFLNRTCFNGLFRVNKKGHFNVPAGKYKSPRILDADNLRKASVLLKNVSIQHASYNEVPEPFLKDAFIYFDPPYRPLSSSSSFTAYSKYSFDDDSQTELAGFFREISNNSNLYLTLSNSDPKNADSEDDFFDILYKGFNIERVKASRMINSNSAKRGKISELLITSY